MLRRGWLDSPRKLAVYCSLPLRCSTNFRALQADDFGKYRRCFCIEDLRSVTRWLLQLYNTSGELCKVCGLFSEWDGAVQCAQPLTPPPPHTHPYQQYLLFLSAHCLPRPHFLSHMSCRDSSEMCEFFSGIAGSKVKNECEHCK